MNEIQIELVKILESFQRICDDLELTYYLANGSALGAQKYGGFIPWDDDIDVAMPRKDYDIFCAKAQEYLPSHLFLQNYKTESNFPFLYTKIRNSNTTFIERDVKKLNINHGIYIDIFPLDGYPKYSLSQLLLKCKLKVFGWMQFCGFENSVRIHHALLRKLGFHHRTNHTLSRIEKTIRKIDSNSYMSCDYADRQGRGRVPWSYYGEGLTAKFEYLTVKIPSKIDSYLAYKYGDYKEDLPVERQKSHHNVIVCDLSSSYKTYTENGMCSAPAADI